MKRSVWAVVAGVLFVVGVTTAVDVVLHATGIFRPSVEPLDDARALLALSYRIVISVGGAWLTARLAPRSPMKHALALGLVGVVLASAGAMATWNLGMGPRWYPLSLVLFAIPQCWAGGWLERVYSLRRSTANAANAA
jgi:hypothetical protein